VFHGVHEKGQNTQLSFEKESFLRTAAPNYTPGPCNPINFNILKSSDWTQGHIIAIRIDGKSLDPGL
jgi:hypothetical protein